LGVLVLLLYLAGRLIMAGPLPSRAPTHFGFNGEPDSYGSPWLAFGITLGLSLLFGLLSIVFDEVWARGEKRKSFNWIALFDELLAGILVGISLGYLRMLENGITNFKLPITDIIVAVGVGLGLGVILEWLRPFRPNPESLTSEDTPIMEKELDQRLKGNQPFIYWQSQNPGWVSVLAIALPLMMITIAVVMWFSQSWFSVFYVVLALVLSLLYGGMRTIVTRQRVTLRFGLLGIRVLRVKTAEIASVELLEFSPIKDFGGYGIRFNGKMYAYYLRGNRGVKITLDHGLKYLIGADHPEQLLAVIKAVSRKTGG
jgi:hypothetical protein